MKKLETLLFILLAYVIDSIEAKGPYDGEGFGKTQ